METQNHFFALMFFNFELYKMAYNKRNYIKFLNYVQGVYVANKNEDIPDTRIVKVIFPKHGIWLSYSQWMRIKNLKQSSLKQVDKVA